MVLDQIGERLISPGDEIVVALGSNEAGAHSAPETMVERGILALGEHGITVIARSRQWRSVAWPDPGQPDYRNAVALVQTDLEPAPLLDRLHRIERAFGRVRSTPNAPRPLDLDLIAYGRRVMTGALALPHPRALERRFVMGPLAELRPAWTHPTDGRTAAELAAAAPVGRDAEPV